MILLQKAPVLHPCGGMAPQPP